MICSHRCERRSGGRRSTEHRIGQGIRSHNKRSVELQAGLMPEERTQPRSIGPGLCWINAVQRMDQALGFLMAA